MTDSLPRTASAPDASLPRLAGHDGFPLRERGRKDPFAATLENAIGDPAIKSLAEEQLEGLEALIDDDADSADELIKEFLRNWKPERAPN
jgi:hypothetical protein